MAKREHLYKRDLHKINMPISSPTVNTRLLESKLYSIKELNPTEYSEIMRSVNTYSTIFSKFFTELSQPIFSPVYIYKMDFVSPEVYNANLKAMYLDILAFYNELNNLATAQVDAFNYASIATEEVTNRADSLASTVLDLSILDGLNRSDIIVAGDDFKSTEFIDSSAATVADSAEILLDGGGIGLAKLSTTDIVDESTVINITPLAPIQPGNDSVNIKPTPGNFERFYEGNYYNYIGFARPEGGTFNIRYISNPAKRDTNEPPVEDGDVHISSESYGGNKRLDGADNPDGFFVDFGASNEVKLAARLAMFDKDPNTFWEGEYLYKLPTSLIGNISAGVVTDGEATDSNTSDGSSETPQGGVINIDIDHANDLAKNYDFTGRDLVIELVVTFPTEKNVNFVAINPILFGSKSYPRVIDIATARENNDQFFTVDGWNTSSFAKTITPEANEFLTDSQIGKVLAPNRYTYKGQGIYPFPSRVAKKVRLLISVEDPVSQPYDKTLILLKKTIKIEGTVTTTTKKGLFA